MESSKWTRIALGLIPATRRASWSRTASWCTYFMGCIERVSSAVGRDAGKGVLVYFTELVTSSMRARCCTVA